MRDSACSATLKPITIPSASTRCSTTCPPINSKPNTPRHQRRKLPPTGKILGAKGEPLRNAVVEIWQCDNNGAYLHSDSANGKKRDGNFQGFGRFLTGTSGEYYFRTIKPVAYPGRTPHIHFKIKQGEK